MDRPVRSRTDSSSASKRTTLGPDMSCLRGPTQLNAAPSADVAVLGAYFAIQPLNKIYPDAITIDNATAFGDAIVAGSGALGRKVEVVAASHGLTDMFFLAPGGAVMQGKNADAQTLMSRRHSRLRDGTQAVLGSARRQSQNRDHERRQLRLRSLTGRWPAFRDRGSTAPPTVE